MIKVYPDISGNYWAEEVETGKRVALEVQGNKLVAPSGVVVARLNQSVGALPLVPLVATKLTVALNKVLPVLKPIIAPLAKFFSNIIKNDNGIIAARDFLTAYIIGRFSGWSGSRAWSGSNRTVPDITDPLIITFKLGNRDIPNVKIGGNYNAETERLVQAMAAYLTMYEPDKLEAFLNALPQYPKPDHAFLYVTTGSAGPWSRDSLLGITAFTPQQVQAAFANANMVDKNFDVQDSGSGSNLINDASQLFNLFRSTSQPNTGQPQQYNEQDPRTQQAGFSGTTGLVALGIAAALLFGGGGRGRKTKARR
jgi:hypothetical protein